MTPRWFRLVAVADVQRKVAPEVGSGCTHNFTLKELLVATGYFNEANFIGEGGCRLMCSWDTTPEDVDALVEDLKGVMGAGQVLEAARAA